MEQVNASEFKARCLRLLERVRQTGEPIEILKNGEPLAIVSPPPPRRRKRVLGAMRNTLKGPVVDLIEPAESGWEALKKTRR
ncbi:MAG: type II toxin-antitoxin system Phd/YefM family antitoxin [Acidobacteria bacterium]|nr:type II toxin-antitoxin system Phd/YefM family antitoxin [Acidobacteriota bacterium]